MPTLATKITRAVRVAIDSEDGFPDLVEPAKDEPTRLISLPFAVKGATSPGNKENMEKIILQLKETKLRDSVSWKEKSAVEASMEQNGVHYVRPGQLLLERLREMREKKEKKKEKVKDKEKDRQKKKEKEKKEKDKDKDKEKEKEKKEKKKVKKEVSEEDRGSSRSDGVDKEEKKLTTKKKPKAPQERVKKEEQSAPVKRGRGRPRKTEAPVSPPSEGKKRGRPKKAETIKKEEKKQPEAKVLMSYFEP